ncbi:MAG: histidinol dehydrogenase [Propionibacteriales bacterium]|nr:histidinol dehydrogenase [Propionibacteriales bacterium]
MMRTIDIRGRLAEGGRVDYRRLVPRADLDVDTAVEVVRPLCDDVRLQGKAALLRQAAEFDRVDISDVRVSPQALGSALTSLDSDVRTSLEASIARLRATCAAELPPSVVTDVAPAGRVTQRHVPVSRVGLYVPAGQAPLVSSVVMNVIPAQVAGVGSIALASPAQREHGGLPHPSILAACALLGVDEVYAAGGAGAIAMFAYGFDDADGGCRPVDLVTGPANIYGVAAKRLLRGVVGIDSEAGPTEIAILADDSANPVYVAADLISQAEHDPAAASVLVTDSADLAAAVALEVTRQVALTKHVERVTTALSGRQSAIVVVDDLDQANLVVDGFAAEHLEIHTRDAADRAKSIRNAGAIFIGPFAPVSLGDYCAGSNHVLPTGGCARHSSGLSVRSFLKTVQLVDYSEQALGDVAGHVVTLAHAEDLPGHADAVRVRLESR